MQLTSLPTSPMTRHAELKNSTDRACNEQLLSHRWIGLPGINRFSLMDKGHDMRVIPFTSKIHRQFTSKGGILKVWYSGSSSPACYRDLKPHTHRARCLKGWRISSRQFLSPWK